MKKNSKKFSTPLVSIIMNCHNGERYLAQSITSVLSQTYKNWELIFFDNKSNDQSKKILKIRNTLKILGTSCYHGHPRVYQIHSES